MGISLNQGFPSVFGIVLSSKHLHNISTCIRKYQFWPKFGATLKIHKKSNFDWNQLIVST